MQHTHTHTRTHKCGRHLFCVAKIDAEKQQSRPFFYIQIHMFDLRSVKYPYVVKRYEPKCIWELIAMHTCRKANFPLDCFECNMRLSE